MRNSLCTKSSWPDLCYFLIGSIPARPTPYCGPAGVDAPTGCARPSAPPLPGVQ